MSDTAMLIRVDHGGTRLVMAEGSKWRVWPWDIPTAILWLPTSEIEIQEITDKECSHELINHSNGERVRAIPWAKSWSRPKKGGPAFERREQPKRPVKRKPKGKPPLLKRPQRGASRAKKSKRS